MSSGEVADAAEAHTGDRLQVGLLLCDHLDPGPAAVAGDYTELYPAAFEPHGLDIRIYEATAGELPTDLDECDAWMTSGSRRSAYEDEGWIHDVRDLIARLAAGRTPGSASATSSPRSRWAATSSGPTSAGAWAAERSTSSRRHRGWTTWNASPSS